MGEYTKLTSDKDKQSARLVKAGPLTISEITFTAGFSSPSYFRQTFRGYHGITPERIYRKEKE